MTVQTTCDTCRTPIEVQLSVATFVLDGWVMPSACGRCLRMLDLILIDGEIIAFDAGPLLEQAHETTEAT